MQCGCILKVTSQTSYSPKYLTPTHTRKSYHRLLISKELDSVPKYQQLDHVAQLAEHWTSIPKVACSIPTVAKQTFQLARCGCILRVTPQTSIYVYLVPSNIIIKQFNFITNMQKVPDKLSLPCFSSMEKRH